MPRETAFEGRIEHLQILSPEGRLSSSHRPTLSPEQIREMFRLMLLLRTFDDKALKLQREGRLGTYASARGQEAAQVGSAFALSPSDWVLPSFREPGVALVRGIPMTHLYLYWSGDERGNALPREKRFFPIAIPVATHLPHAVGIAYAIRFRREQDAVAVYFGDGATSKGDFHEAMNFAGVFTLPVLFICQNNLWAISVPLSRQTRSKTLAQKALAYGFDGLQVDGNDPFAVYEGTREALEQIRKGKGPFLLECLTYRIGDHTTADDASRYRSQEDVERWLAHDPLERLRRYMEREGLWNPKYGEEVAAEAAEQVAAAVQEFESTPPQPLEAIFSYMFAEPTEDLAEQMRSIREE